MPTTQIPTLPSPKGRNKSGVPGKIVENYLPLDGQKHQIECGEYVA